MGNRGKLACQLPPLGSPASCMGGHRAAVGGDISQISLLSKENQLETMKSSLPKGPPLDLPGALDKSGLKKGPKGASFGFVFVWHDLPRAPGRSKGGPFGRLYFIVFHLFSLSNHDFGPMPPHTEGFENPLEKQFHFIVFHRFSGEQKACAP